MSTIIVVDVVFVCEIPDCTGRTGPPSSHWPDVYENYIGPYDVTPQKSVKSDCSSFSVYLFEYQLNYSLGISATGL